MTAVRGCALVLTKSVTVTAEGSLVNSTFQNQWSVVSKSGPSSKKARLRESPHTCCIPQLLAYTSVYKGSTAFWPAASGTQCKARIRVNLYWGGGGKESSADSYRWTVQLAPTTKHETQTPFSNFSSSRQTLFLQRVSYLTAEKGT